MRHAKHRHSLGVKKEHRKAMLSNMAAALLTHGRIETTLSKAKALRPFVEKLITLAKKAGATEERAKKLHYRRLAYARMNNQKDAVNLLFEEKASEFANRTGGYTRIYKLVPRIGDAADLALIELIDAGDEGYGKKKRRKKSKSENKAKQEAAPAAEAASEEAPAAEEAPAEAPEAEAASSAEATAPEAEDEKKDA